MKKVAIMLCAVATLAVVGRAAAHSLLHPEASKDRIAASESSADAGAFASEQRILYVP